MSDESETPRRGRPPKAAEERQGKVVAVRFSEGGYGVLEALLRHQHEQMAAIGVDPADYSAAHVLRDLVTRRARELGIVAAAPPAPPSAEPRPAKRRPGPKPGAKLRTDTDGPSDDALRAGVRQIVERGTPQTSIWEAIGWGKASGSRWLAGASRPEGGPQRLTKRTELAAYLTKAGALG